MRCLHCDSDSAAGSEICGKCGTLLETDPDWYFKAGMEAMAAGDIARSIGYLADCVHLNPDHLSGKYNLGVAMSLVNRCDEAMEHLAEIAKQKPDYPGVYTALGQAAFGSYLAHAEQVESKRRTMVRFLRKAIERDSEDVDAYFSLANAYIALGTADLALPCLRHAMKLHPDSAAIHFVTAKAFKMLDKYPEAVVMARKSMQLSEPTDPFWADIESLVLELQQTYLPL